MSKKIVSVIIPVFNGEKFLDTCISGLISQTVSQDNVEIIFVNDGSTDKSIHILHEYESKYPNFVTVIDQKNSGAGMARNRALSEAKSDYVIPVDCDDIVDNDYIEVLLKTIQTSKADYALAGFTLGDGSTIHETVLPSGGENAKYRMTLTCGKIYKKDFLMKHGIRYTKAYIMEDPYFNLRCAMRASRVGVAQYAGYHVVVRPKAKGQLTSATMVRDNNPYVYEMIQELINQYGDFAKNNKRLFTYLAVKLSVNNLLANKLEWDKAREGIMKQLDLLKSSDYRITLMDIMLTKEDALLKRGVVACIVAMIRLRILSVFYKLYHRISL